MKGATAVVQGKALYGCNFNPRTHEGCDAEQTIGAMPGIIISIHAPMKGATTKTGYR